MSFDSEILDSFKTFSDENRVNYLWAVHMHLNFPVYKRILENTGNSEMQE